MAEAITVKEIKEVGGIGVAGVVAKWIVNEQQVAEVVEDKFQQVLDDDDLSWQSLCCGSNVWAERLLATSEKNEGRSSFFWMENENRDSFSFLLRRQLKAVRWTCEYKFL